MVCGIGGNVIWLVGQGRNATGIDFSDAAIELARSLASDAKVNAKFLVADAANDQTLGESDLFTMFCLHLPIDDRAGWLANVS